MSTHHSSKNPPRRSLWQRWFVPRLRKWVNPKIIRLHYDLFDWHCKTFFPFDQHMTQLEQAYVKYCFDLAEFEPVPFQDSGYDEYSYFTYSHRIAGRDVNSSRMAIGSLMYPHETLDSARAVLNERSIEIDPYFLDDPNSLFYGLGWDFLAGQFKVYFRILDVHQLTQPTLLELYESAVSMLNPRTEGLVSFTYINNQLHEEKVYLYPEPEAEEYEDIFPGTKGRVIMATSRRGAITQYDVSSTKTWKQRMSEEGYAIIQSYKSKGHALDTITMKDKENYTLYFPGAFMPFFRKETSPNT